MKAYGNLMNRVAEDCKPAAPAVGIGATILMFSDRHAATVTQVLGPRHIVIQEDTCKRTDENGMSECQSYDYLPNPNGAIYHVRQNKTGRWVISANQSLSGTVVLLGQRDEYRDFSF